MNRSKKVTLSTNLFRVSEMIILTTVIFVVLIKVYYFFLNEISIYIEPAATIIQVVCILLILILYILQKKRITVYKEREKLLLEEKEKAEESNRMKSAFLANMSHEIRTPLNAVVGFSSILAESSPDNEEYTHFIEQNNNLLLQIIDDILDLSKIEAGVLDFSYTTFDLGELMEEVRDVIRYKISNNNVTLKLEMPPERCIFRSDRKRLTQVITNFLTNAYKFTEKGTITFGYDFREKGFLCFYVTDTGCGIPPEALDDVFDRFTRLNPSIRGTGLGLSICKLIVERMGGRIGVESAVKAGSTFWFTLPINRD